MALSTFSFPMHTFETRYPESSTKMSFGGGYEFASKPKAPDQVEYVLHFQTMKFFLAAGVVDRLSNPQINMAKLEDFYRTHRQYQPFLYPHPSDGIVTVRFKTPLTFKQALGGLGTVEPFSVELITQP